MQTGNGNPTMKDVAREAGVALGTVSKVVNGIPVGEPYKEKVEAAVKKLNYRVNNYAKGLKSSQTYIIQVIVPNLVNPFFATLVHYIYRDLARRGYKMLLGETDSDPEMEQESVFLAEQQKVDGIICLSYNPKLQAPEKVPLISIDRYFGARIPCVSCDNYGGGRLAAEMLVENGCKNLAFLRIGSSLTNEPNKRKDGFVNGCEGLGVPYTMKIVDDYTPYSEFVKFLQEHYHGGKLDFDGIFCVTDSLAYQIVGTLKEMKVRVPEDVQVIGFDGIRQFGDMDYFCSTIVQPVEEMAEQCVQMVLEKDASKKPALVCLPVRYAKGGTTRV